MEILIDTNGSDNGIDESILAACNMQDKVKSKIILVGDKEKICGIVKEKYLNNANNILNKIGIIDAKDVITNYDEPAMAIKNKKESSIVKAYDYMKNVSNTVFISAGNTGSVMAGGLLKLKRIDGVYRPALATILPTEVGNGVVLLDCGANVAAADVSLLQFAQMGAIYAKEVLGKNNIKVGLLNIGAENKKGTPELQEAYKLLEEKCPEFVGNAEAREILTGNFDVIVTCGLSGNIALKSLEGTAKVLKDALIMEFKKNVFNKIAASFSINIIKNALKKYDYTKYGGAILLGVKKPVIKIHGNAKQINYELAIMQAENVLKKQLIEKVEVTIEKCENT